MSLLPFDCSQCKLTVCPTAGFSYCDQCAVKYCITCFTNLVSRYARKKQTGRILAECPVCTVNEARPTLDQRVLMWYLKINGDNSTIAQIRAGYHNHHVESEPNSDQSEESEEEEEDDAEEEEEDDAEEEEEEEGEITEREAGEITTPIVAANTTTPTSSNPYGHKLSHIYARMCRD